MHLDNTRTMTWKTLLFCLLMGGLFTACFATDEALSGPTAANLENARRVGELPLDAVLESVTFFNANTGEEMTVALTAPAFSFENCNSDWCPVADATTGNTYFCPGQDPSAGSDNGGSGLQFSYNEEQETVAFDNFRGSPPFDTWAERGLDFNIEIEGQDVRLLCNGCSGKYEDFEYTDRQVNLRSQD